MPWSFRVRWPVFWGQLRQIWVGTSLILAEDQMASTPTSCPLLQNKSSIGKILPLLAPPHQISRQFLSTPATLWYFMNIIFHWAARASSVVLHSSASSDTFLDNDEINDEKCQSYSVCWCLNLLALIIWHSRFLYALFHFITNLNLSRAVHYSNCNSARYNYFPYIAPPSPPLSCLSRWNDWRHAIFYLQILWSRDWTAGA